MIFKFQTLSIALSAACLVFTAAPSQAGGFFGLSIGYYNALDGDDHSADFRAEIQPDSHIFLKNLKPWAGIELTTYGTLWAGGGLLYDIELNDKFTLTPSFGAGLYLEGGDDIDLGHPIEFRSQIELSYKLQSDARIGLAFSHMSNAGLDKQNPGVETILLKYHIPLHKIWGKASDEHGI